MLSSRTTGGVVAINLVTGGSQYAAAPTVSISGGSGTGCTAICHMAGTRVESVVIVNQGTDYTSAPTITLNAATGSGAVAEAKVYAGSLRPMNFFQGRFGDVYGVDGMGRGIRWDNAATTAEPIGLVKPANAPTVTGGTTVGKFVKDITVVRAGGGYVSEPSVTFTGGAPAEAADGRAVMQSGRVVGVRLTSRGRGYLSTPQVSFSGGIGDPSQFNVGISGRVHEVRVISGGEGYGERQAGTGAGAVAVTSEPSSDYINAGAHGLTNDDPFYLAAVSGNTNLSVNVTYYAVSVNATQIQAATITGGAGITLTSPITAGFLVDPANNLYIDVPYHGLLAGSTVSFSSISGGSGIAPGVRYYATSVEASRFKVAISPSATIPQAFVTDITASTVAIPPPRIEFGTQYGLTTSGTNSPNAVVRVDGGKVVSVSVLASGTGATTGSTAVVVGGGGTGASVSPDMRYGVASITAATSGSGYFAAPILTIRPATTDTVGSGAKATVSVNDSGQITAVNVFASGEYRQKPQALILDTTAQATAEMSPAITGKYLCAIRYIDDTPRVRRGPVSSSISDTVEVDVASGVGSLLWSFSHAAVDTRVTAMELWRSTADQSTVLFRVATIGRTDPEWTAGYEDTLSEPELISPTRDGYGLLPVNLPSGQVNARRFGVPPGNFAVGVIFQDRAWYAVDTTGDKPNSLFYSEIDEPESVPSVNELVIQQNTGTPDQVKALVPLATDLLIAQDAHLYKLSYVAQPVIDAAVSLVGYRGILNERCWSVMGGVAFIADSFGLYAFDGMQEEPISVPIDNYWREGIIDMSKAGQFHVSSDYDTKTVRFHYCQSSDASPTRALCYCVATQAWWEETYPEAVTATCSAFLSSRYQTVTTSGGQFLKSSGVVDQGGQGIPYRFRTGNMALTDDRQDSRAFSVVYKPTQTDSQLGLGMYYNNSDTPRANAISSDRGDGFVASAGTQASLNMKLTRSSLGEANGMARAYHSGRNDPRSAGSDKHIATELSGTQSGTAGDDVAIYGISLDGAG
jgi:hypothetical protein